jgi:serine/threonine protein kinase
VTGTSEPTATDPLIGKVAADRYRILEPIAKGGMGRIYKAEQVGLGRMVALKVLDDRTLDPEGFRKRFTLEAATSAKLSHPNIVVVHDYGSFELDGVRRYFMAMELIDGPTLSAVLKQEGRLPLARAAFIAREVARALRDAHRQGVVHRDLKPSNVMLVARQDGEHVKVLDFGIAKVMQTEDDSEEQLTHEGVLVGTPRYMSPEQLTGGAVDPRSDLYSLGVLLFQMISGRTPHAARDHMQAFVAHLQEPMPELPEDVVNDVPPALRDVIRTCLQKTPTERFADATAFLGALDAASANLPGWMVAGGPVSSGEHQMPRMSGAPEDPSYPSYLTGSGPRSVASVVGTPPPQPLPTAGPDAPTRVERPDPTPAPVAPAPASPAVDSSSGSRAGLVATIGVLVALLVGVVAWALSRSPNETSAPPPTTTAHAPTPPPTTTTPPPTTAPIEPEPARFRLTIASTPLGATVTESGRVVGQTPITLELDPEALLTAPREYRLELEGHAPYLFTQGPSARDVEVMASLVALPARPVRGERPVRTERPRGDGPAIGPPEDRMLKTSR